MRITYLSASYIPSRTANSIQVMKMCQAFSANGHMVTLLAVRSSNHETLDTDHAYYGVDPCFEVVKCWDPKKRIGKVLHALGVIRVVKSRPRPDIFYTRYPYGLTTVAPFCVPMILEVHDVPHSRLAKSMMKLLFRQQHFVRLVTISDSLRREYRRLFPELVPDKMVVAHDGADVDQQIQPAFSPMRSPGRTGALQVGYVGHLYPGKGMEVIIPLASAMPDLDFQVIGGTDEDIAKWRGLCKAPNVLFRGYVPHSETPRFCAHCDVTLAPYQQSVAISGGGGDVSAWMSPLKIFEYMALGKAIVCSDLPVLREILTDNINALLVPPADVDAWIQALSRLKADPQLRARLGSAAQRTLISEYTWEKRAATVLADLS